MIRGLIARRHQGRTSGVRLTDVGKLPVHTAAYAVLLAFVMAVIPLDASFGGDDGAYGGQVYALQNGAWTLDRPLPVVDQANEGWLNTTITPDGPTPYSSNPFYAVLLKTTADVVPGGSDADGHPDAEAGAGANGFALQLIPVVGALVAAVVAWLLAAQLAPPSAISRSAPLAFWFTALGPVLVNSTTLWAHTLSTALGGLAVLALVKLSDQERSRSALLWALVLVASLGFSAAVRTEAIFWVAAVGLTSVLVMRQMRVVVAATVACGFSGAVWLANRTWGSSLRADKLPIETSVEALRPNSGWLESRLPAAWRLLMTSVDSGIGPLLSLIAVTLALFAAIKLRTAPDADRRFIRGLLLGSALIYGAQAVVAPGDLISGTIAAWPVVAFLLIAPTPSDDEGASSLAVLLVPSALLLLAVLVTQYSASGGLQWGGRYLSMAFVPLAVAAAIAGRELFVQYRPALLALLVMPAIVGVVASHQLHTKHQTVVEDATSMPAEVVITEIHALPRIAWTALPTAFYVASEDDVEALLSDLAGAEVSTVNVQGFGDVELDGAGGYRLTAEASGVRHLELTPELP